MPHHTGPDRSYFHFTPASSLLVSPPPTPATPGSVGLSLAYLSGFISPSSLPPVLSGGTRCPPPPPRATHSVPTLQGAPSCCTQPTIIRANPRARLPSQTAIPSSDQAPQGPPPGAPQRSASPYKSKRDIAEVTRGSGSRIPGSAIAPAAGCPLPAPAAVPSSRHQPAAGQREETWAQPTALATRSRLCPRLPSDGPGGRPRRRVSPRVTPMPPGVPSGFRGI